MLLQISAYALEWTTPAADASDSVPMGNGVVAANVWMEADGGLHLLLARHDTHSEAARLLKPGQVRLAFDPPPGGEFRQTLDLATGLLEVSWGDLAFAVFAEPDSDRFRVAGRTGSPRTVHARAESWRTAPRRLAGDELASSWTMRGAPDAVPVFESADRLYAAGDAAFVVHSGGASVVPFTLRHQGIAALADLCGDPLADLRFQVILLGEGGAAQPPADVLLRDATTFDFRIAVPAPIQTPDPSAAAAWSAAALQRTREAPPAADARAATIAHWESFWNRSWIFVSGDPAVSYAMPRHAGGGIRLGADSAGGNLWTGEFARALVRFGAGASAMPVPPTPVSPRERVTTVTIEGEPAAGAPTTISMAAWLRRDPCGEPARILDWITAGGSDGFLFDTHPGNDLRLIVGTRTLVAPGAWPDDGQWHAVAATYDERDGAMAIWRDGERVAATAPAAPTPPSRVTQAYVLQRWMTACQGRGAYPIKFNGGLFTVAPRHAGGPGFDADWRRWGESFWWQNTRLPYYPMLAAGDFDLMDPLFSFYERILPLCRARARLYYGAEGAFFPETVTPFGTYANGDYGWDREGAAPGEIHCPWWQWSWSQGLELVDLMLQRDAYARSYPFARDHLLPMAREVLKYFDTRFPRDERGILRITPTQALETHWHGVVDDMPCVAGLHAVLPRLRALPEPWLTDADRALYDRLLAALPPLPVREQDGARLFAPAGAYDPSRQNVETPELYATFPFRLAAVGGDAERLALAREAYARRHDRQDRGWTQDGIFAARLGLAAEARADLLARVGNTHPNFRFPAMWGPNFDWLPDQCHGGNLMTLLQEMLLQSDGTRILLFPAWPRDWDVRFKLRAPRGTVVEAELRAGELVRLEVAPAARRADVVLMLN